MRNYQTITRKTYAELVCVLPNTGLTTLYRGNSFADAKSYQAYQNLREFHGKKVSVVERSSEVREQTGWIFKDINSLHEVTRYDA